MNWKTVPIAQALGLTDFETCTRTIDLPLRTACDIIDRYRRRGQRCWT